jgi:hypothetical protein
MVDVASQTALQARRWAEKLIPRLLHEWRELPQTVAEIDSWDDGDALDYIEEWRLRESQRYDLERDAEQGLLTPSQLASLEELQRLVQEHKPLLDSLLRRSADGTSPGFPTSS